MIIPFMCWKRKRFIFTTFYILHIFIFSLFFHPHIKKSWVRYRSVNVRFINLQIPNDIYSHRRISSDRSCAQVYNNMSCIELAIPSCFST